MVDVDRRVNTHAHVAGLKRLSARASKGPLASNSPRKGCFSFAPLASSVIERLRKCKIQIAKGLSDEEFSRIEAAFAFSFPPDLKAILQEGLPVGAGFPDWRSGGLQQLRLTLNLPIAGLSYEVARRRFWAKQWGPRPAETEQAVCVARAALMRVPILIPVYRYCYIPASPNLAGNPVFFVCQKDAFYCGYDLANFFEREAFASQDYELPFDFANLDVVHGRAASLGGGADWVWENGKSFRLEKPPKLAKNDSVRERRRVHFESQRYVGGEAELADDEQREAPQWRCEEPSRDIEAWGRNLDALARRYDPSARNAEFPRRSFKVFDRHQASRRCDPSPGSINNSTRLAEDDDPSSDHNLGDGCPSAKTLNSNLLAKTARRIEFWSDLAEKRYSVNDTAVDHLFSCVKVDSDLEKTSVKQVGLEDRSKCAPHWLESYLDEMARILRNGGWKEEDVTEMISVVSPPREEPNSSLDRQSILEGLVLYVNLLSDALRRAGWSTQDVAEALDVDLSFREQKRRPSTVPPHLAARLGKLAEYVAQF